MRGLVDGLCTDGAQTYVRRGSAHFWDSNLLTGGAVGEAEAATETEVAADAAEGEGVHHWMEPADLLNWA